MEKEFQIDPGFCFILALTLLALPLRWVIAWFTAVLVHECFHVGAVLAFGHGIKSVHIGFKGVVLKISPLSTGGEIFAAVAGPVGSILLIFLYRQMPLVALCGCVHGVFNMLPVYPLDGGRVVRCMLVHILGSKKGVRIADLIGQLFFAASVLTGIALLQISVLPLVACVVLAAKILKIPCKTLAEGVQ